MSKVTPTSHRKAEHIRIALRQDAHAILTNGLERYHFQHRALPELDFGQIDTSTTFLGKLLRAPILVSSMTGGTKRAGRLNRILAEAAQQAGLAMGLGSLRAAVEDPSLSSTFQVRHVAPDILLFANLGAVQLNYGYDAAVCQRVVDLAQADALVLHLNALQEALQPEGNLDFSGLLRRIEAVCKSLSVPVIAKEVGWGIGDKDARLLAEAGVSAIDVAGAGGTSWSQVEMRRRPTPRRIGMAKAFAEWGIPTAEAVVQVRQALPRIPLIASGGIRTGVDVAKCIALGANLAGIASPLLKAAAKSPSALARELHQLQEQLRVCMLCTGSASITDLARAEIGRAA
jgi:isopentenyl-diphosphate delta-isomerase